ncbi:MAG: signal peptidase II [Syntrophales bacterium]|nr:signal peptidase II [Syntrophales bacterium]
MKPKWKIECAFILPALIVIVLDQLTKVWIDTNLPLHASIPVIPGFFHITYVRNPGAAFGFLAQASPGLRSIFFLAVAVLAVILILYYLHQYPERPSIFTYALSFIFSGAIGNMIDRVRLGAVIDFLDFFLGDAHWPAFNVADSAITVGAALLFYALIKDTKKTGRN